MRRGRAGERQPAALLSGWGVLGRPLRELAVEGFEAVGAHHGAEKV